LASAGLIHGVNNEGLAVGVSAIAVPNHVAVPFHDYMGTARLDWAQSARSQWFLRGSGDNYPTRNDLVQQATLPSTGAISGSNYLNLVLGNQYTFSPTWLGSLTFGASGLHHTESRNQYLGFALAFPFSATFHTISGFETFGDNQFATPITAFPVLRNQEKYQLRYDVSHATGRHAPKFGINLIHEPVLSGALSGMEETLISYPQNPDFYVANPGQFYFDPTCASATPDPNIGCTNTPAGDGSFSQHVERLGLYAQDSWRVSSPGGESGVPDAEGAGDWAGERDAARLSKAARSAPGLGVLAGAKRADGDSRGDWNLLQRPGPERLGERLSGGKCGAGGVRPSGRCGMHSGRRPGGAGGLAVQDAVCVARKRRGAARSE